MGKNIHFEKSINSAERTKKRGIIKKIEKYLGIISAICGILGFSVFGLIKMAAERDWQAIAEQYNNEALALYDSGEYEQAIELYDKAIELEPKGIEDAEVCYFNRGRAYHKLGDYQKAIGDYTKAIELNPNSEYYSTRAVAYEEIGDTMNASLDNVRALTSMIE